MIFKKKTTGFHDKSNISLDARSHEHRNIPVAFKKNNTFEVQRNIFLYIILIFKKKTFLAGVGSKSIGKFLNTSIFMDKKDKQNSWTNVVFQKRAKFTCIKMKIMQKNIYHEILWQLLCRYTVYTDQCILPYLNLCRYNVAFSWRTSQTAVSWHARSNNTLHL